MTSNLIEKSINKINLKENILNILYDNNIITIQKLCNQTKTDLKNISLTYKDIYKIEVELQLLGLNLKNNE